jgi:signal transduction histidine kinase
MVSHEFRSPLAVIDISAQLLAKKPVVQTDSKAATLVTRIRRGTVRLAQFLDTCLTQDRLRDTGLLLKPAALDLAALAGAASEGAQLLADHHRIVTEVQPDLPPLQGDAELLRILLANLLSNAVKYSSPASEIRLRVTNVGDRHILEIIDQGCGIPADEMPHIFKKYRRGRLAAGKPGAGLGLALGLQIVELHGGSIRVNSTQDRGTQVVVEFPAESSADANTSQLNDLKPA